jgi:arginine exporter protein ArgO
MSPKGEIVEQLTQAMESSHLVLLADPARDASEVFSLMRVSGLDPDAYLDTFFQTGAERERVTE